MLTIDANLIAQLDRHAVAGYPHEVCGLLVGCHTPQETMVRRLEPCRNLAIDRPEDRYLLDPDDFLRADSAARRDGLEIVGVWHTHPDHPAQPSDTDLASAWEGYSYVIASVNDSGVADRRSWRLSEARFIEQEIQET